jgi:hypothetical protein
MRATYACSRGVVGESKVDYFRERSRVRGDLLYTAMLPEHVRFDVVSPFGAILSTLTSNGREFALYDPPHRDFLRGPANTCNLARFTQVPIPPFALVELLRGEAPVLVHEPSGARIDWGSGHYVVRVSGKYRAEQEIHLEPRPDDWSRPWTEQRVRVLEVRVEQAGYELYQVELAGHAAVRRAAPRVDPDGLGPDIPPSGPQCGAEVPMRLRMRVPDTDRDLLLQNREIYHNPPIVSGTFEQTPPKGVRSRYSPCPAEVSHARPE